MRRPQGIAIVALATTILTLGTSARAVTGEEPLLQADLALTKSDSADPVLEGTEFSYTLTARNLGPEEIPASPIVFDLLPADVAFVSAPTGCTHSGEPTGGSIVCEIDTPTDTLPVGFTRELTITVRALDDAVVENTAGWLFADLDDPDLSNNTDTETTTIGTEPRSQVDSEIALDNGPFIGLGTVNPTGTGQARVARLAFFQRATFRVRIHNQGPVADIAKLSAPSGHIGFRVRYFDGSTDVTAAVVAGTHTTGLLAPGAVDELVVRVRPRVFLALLRPQVDLPVRARSQADPSAQDVVLASARLRLR